DEAALGLEGPGPRAHVGLGGLEERLRLGQRRPARPALDEAGVARGRHRALAEVGGDEEGVLVHARRAALRLRQEEAVLDEGPGDGVELARLDGAGAAAREGDEAAAVVGREAVGPLVDPGAALGRGEGVDVEDGLPGGIAGEVVVPPGAAPDAALVPG